MEPNPEIPDGGREPFPAAEGVSRWLRAGVGATLPQRCALAIVASVAALLSRMAMAPLLGSGNVPYLTFYLAVVVVSVLAGAVPGILATAVSAALAQYWIVPHPNGGPGDPRHVAGLAIFAATGIFTSVLAGYYRRAAHRAELFERLLAVRASDVRRHGVFENIRDLVLVVEAVKGAGGDVADWIVREANEPALGALGARREDLVGKSARELRATPLVAVGERWPAILAGGVPWDYEASHGGSDYLVRTFRIDDATIGIAATDITRRKRAEAALRESEKALHERERREALRERDERFEALIQNSTDVIFVLGEDRTVRFWSPGATAVLGWSEPEALGRQAAELWHEEDAEIGNGTLDRVLAGPGATERATLRFCHRDGSFRVAEAVARNLLHVRAVQGIVVNARDITEQRRLQAEFQEAQKLESVARLAGGVAHDFNNLLTAILGAAEVLREDLAEARPISREDVETVNDAAQRGKQLTRQLLAFARKQAIVPLSMDLNAFVHDAEKLLRRLIPESIRLDARLAPDLRPVLCDPGQLQQVVMNLAVNAGDAMPRGGVLVLETANVRLDAWAAAELGAPTPGDYVRLTVRDTGVGLTPEARAHLFEPFFTTKGPGRGTGLGLATVYGIVKQSGGGISVESEPDAGTAFHLYLPESHPNQEEARPTPEPVARGKETVLVVEDDPLVRGIAARALRRGGYRVLVARDAGEALRIAASPGTEFDLLLTDVVMPGMNGRELATALLRERPSLRVLFMSGYTQDSVVLGSGPEFLPKPFHTAALLAGVRSALDAR